MFTLFVAIVSILMQFNAAFTFTPIKPRPDMHDLGDIGINQLYAVSGAWVTMCDKGKIVDYVVWLNPVREPMYLINTDNGYTAMIKIEELEHIKC